MSTSPRPRRRRLLLALGAAAILGLALAAVLLGGRSEELPSGLRVGVSANLSAYSGEKLRRRAAAVRAVGVGWVREDFDWSEVESTRGRRDWSELDEMMTASARAGLRVLPVVGFTPRWAGPEEQGPPDDRREFARFMAAVVRRYGPNGDFWRVRPSLPARLAPTYFEVWNEPYFDDFWRPKPDPAAYAQLYAATVRAGRRANPRARFMLAADTVSEGKPWLSALYEAVPGLPALTDAVAVHPYPAEQVGPTEWTPDEPARDKQVRRVELIHDEMVARGDGADPIWITEIGWPTAPTASGVSEEEQADYLEQTFELARTRWGDYVEGVFWFEWDGEERDPDDKQEWFGLGTLAGRDKPALERLRKTVRP